MSSEGSVTGKFSIFWHKFSSATTFEDAPNLRKKGKTSWVRSQKVSWTKTGFGKNFLLPFHLVGRRTTRENNNYKNNNYYNIFIPRRHQKFKLSLKHGHTRARANCSLLFFSKSVLQSDSRRDILTRCSLASHQRMARVAREEAFVSLPP